jgi:protein-disulfide isomerase/uncharacterized membrane protein/rhodanese-related sulfurtransferase
MRKLILLGLTLVGLFDSAFLWWVYASPTHGMACVGSGCDVVRNSSYAYLWGLHLPAYGVAMYAALALLILAGALVDAQRERILYYGMTAVSAGGFLASLFLTYIEAYVLHAWCVWCVTSAVAVTVIFVLTILEFFRPSSYADSAARLVALRRYAAVLTAGILLSVPAFMIFSRAEGAPPPPPQASAPVLEERLVRPDSHAFGNPKSPVTVVEFGDFQCPVCGIAEKTTRKIREAYGSRIRFVFRQFPLVNLHAHAEAAAEASECAADQGKFWPAFETLYDKQNDLTDPAIEHYMSELGLDMNRFRNCYSSGAMVERIQRDVEDARAVGVDRTPTFFVNERRIIGAIPYEEFAQLLDQELAKHGVAPPVAATMSQDSPTAASPNRAASAESPVSPEGATSSESGSFFSNPGGNIFTQLGSSSMACSEEDAKKKQPTVIGTAEARRLFQGGSDTLFVDVRTSKEFRVLRIPKAVNLPADEIEKLWTELPKGRDIVLYESGNAANPDDICAAGRAAGRFLLTHGFSYEKVKVYRDGLKAWQAAGLPVERPASSGP